MIKTTQKLTKSGTYSGAIPKTPLAFLWYVTSPHRLLATIAMVSVTLAAILEVLEVYAISRLIDNFSIAENLETQLSVLYYWGSVFFVLLVLRTACWRVSGFSGIAWMIKENATAYKELYRYVLEHSHGYFVDRFAGSLSNKISNASDGSSRILDQFMWRLWPEIIGLVATLYLFFKLHWSVGVATIAIVGAVIVYNVWRVKKRRPFVVAYSASSSKLRGEGVDVLTNISAVRQYSRKDQELLRLKDAIDEKTAKDFKQWYMGEWTMVGNGLLGNATILCMLIIVFSLLASGQATAGSLVLVLILLSRVSFTFNIMGMLMNGFARQFGEVEEGLEAVLLPYEINDAVKAKNLKVNNAGITWNNVLFEYGKNKVFDDFNLTIKSGERVGLVGPSGAGKTTFVSLMLRQHDLQAGDISIDGQNIAKVTQDSLREAIAIVPQEPMLFHRSIRENIAYGKPDAINEEIEAVAKKAQAHEFISALEDKYDTLVGERGVKLSGGQKQRVAIARAMLKDAPILILDEATSALDSESEVAIQKALHELMEGKTVVAIAHRLSTLREMDRILVLEGGKIVEDGSHKTLAEAGGTYQRLWEHQAGGFLQE